MTAPGDERRHEPGDEPGWVESWAFDFATSDAALGGLVRLTVRPHDGVCWYWAYLVGAGRDPVMLVDDEVALPRNRSLEIRADGLWADHVVEEPLDHISVGLEAFALRLDHPNDALGRLWGERVGFGLDLGWETEGDLVPDADGYEMPCRVVGEVLVGEERIELDAFGWRSHTWGAVDLWQSSWSSLRGRFDDGGWVGTDISVAVEPVAFAPLVVPQLRESADRSSAAPLLNVLCRVRELGSGRAGAGWLTWNRAFASSDRTKAVPGR